MISFAKLFSHYLITSKMKGKAFYADFFEPSHSSKSLQTTAAILDAFSKKSNKVLYVFFPQEQDFVDHADESKWLYSPLMEELKRINPNAKVLNIGDHFGEGISGYLAPHKHYNDKGNQVVSEAMYKELKSLGWLESKAQMRPGLMQVN